MDPKTLVKYLKLPYQSPVAFVYTRLFHRDVTVGNLKIFFRRNRFPKYPTLCNRGFCSEIRCWNCGIHCEAHNGFFCSNCGKLLEVRSDNYFKLMSIDEKFNVNLDYLTKRHRELQVLVHPDKFCNSEEKERLNSMEWSSLLNKAYEILSQPLKRGEYILNEKGFMLSHDNMLNQEFLQEIMKQNEEIGQLDQESIRVHLTKLRETLRILGESVGCMLDEGNYDEAKNVLVKMKYYKSLETAIKERILNMRWD